MTVLLVDPLLVFLLLDEPASVLGFLHYDLNAGARHMQLVIDRVEELFGRIDGLASTALVVRSRGRVQGRGFRAQLIMERVLTLLCGALPFQRVLQAVVRLKHLLILSLLPGLLIRLFLLFCFDLVLPLLEDLIDHGGATLQNVLQVLLRLLLLLGARLRPTAATAQILLIRLALLLAVRRQLVLLRQQLLLRASVVHSGHGVD